MTKTNTINNIEENININKRNSEFKKNKIENKIDEVINILNNDKLLNVEDYKENKKFINYKILKIFLKFKNKESGRKKRKTNQLNN